MTTSTSNQNSQRTVLQNFIFDSLPNLSISIRSNFKQLLQTPLKTHKILKHRIFYKYLTIISILDPYTIDPYTIKILSQFKFTKKRFQNQFHSTNRSRNPRDQSNRCTLFIDRQRRKVRQRAISNANLLRDRGQR